MAEKIETQECCPRFDPKPWDGQVHEWQNKRFIKGHVCTLFYMPINFGRVMTGLMKKIEAAGAKQLDNLSLADHTSKWNMDLYLAVDREIPGTENVTLSGKILSKVYEGGYGDISGWEKDFASYLKGRGLETKKQFMWYTTCPKCAKKWGKNYVVIVAEIK